MATAIPLDWYVALAPFLLVFGLSEGYQSRVATTRLRGYRTLVHDFRKGSTNRTPAEKAIYELHEVTRKGWREMGFIDLLTHGVALAIYFAPSSLKQMPNEKCEMNMVNVFVN